MAGVLDDGAPCRGDQTVDDLPGAHLGRQEEFPGNILIERRQLKSLATQRCVSIVELKVLGLGYRRLESLPL